MLILLFSLIHIAILTLSWGFLMQEILKKTPIFKLESSFSADILSVFGFCWLTAFVNICSIFIAIDSTFQLVISLFSLLIFAVKFNEITKGILPDFTTVSFKNNRFYIIFYAIFIFILFYEAAGPTKINDSKLYHLAAINWIEQYPTVPGLANLYGQLGLHSAAFSVSALFILRGLFSQPILAVNLFFLILILYRSSKEAMRAMRDKNYGWVVFNFGFLFILFFQLKGFISSCSPDLLLTILIYYTFIVFINFKNEWLLNEQFIFLAVLTFTIPTIKISQIFAPLLIFILAYNQKALLKKHFWLTTLGFFSIFIIPWLVKSVILSGYLIFPFYQLDLFNFDWEMPKFSERDNTLDITSASSVLNLVKSWARVPGQHYHKVLAMPVSEWIGLWFRALSSVSKLMILGAAFSPVGFLILRFKNAIIEKKIYQIYIFSYLNLIYWWLSAPDPRFAQANIIFCLLLPITFVFEQLKEPTKRVGVRVIFSLFFGYLIFTMFISAKNRVTIEQLSTTILRPTPLSISVGKMENGVNFQYLVPTDFQCNDTPTPCTPFQNSHLEMRGKTLRDGFRMKSN